MPRTNERSRALESGLVKLRKSTELALGYPSMEITPSEARALLDHIEVTEAHNRLLSSARDDWYAKERILQQKLKSVRTTLRDRDRWARNR